jgi:diguanylate cyclase (GGDEF)-like protein/PAS domain S-box-containing protein
MARYFTEPIGSSPKGFSIEHRIIRNSDGCERWIRALGEIEPDNKGHPHRIRGTLQDVTDYKLAHVRITEANNKLQGTLDALPDLLFEVGGDGYIYQYHSHRSDLLAAPPEVFLGRRFEEILPPEASLVCRRAIDESTANGYSSGHRYSLDLQDGEHWFELSVAPMLQTDGSDSRFIFISRDVTERYQAERKLELAGLVFSHSREGIMITDANGGIVDVNDAFTEITGYSRSDVLGKNPRLLSSRKQSKAFYAAMWSKLNEDGFWDGEIWNRRKDGSDYVELLTISTVRDSSGKVVKYVALFSDISPLKEYQLELENLAHYDALTGLPNRLLLSDRMAQAMIQSKRRGTKVLVAYLDLDNFKAINDQYGQATGDHLLIALGQRINDHLRDGDTLARIGGDEFVAVLADFDSVESVLPLVSRIVAAASEPFELNGSTICTSTSVGITLFPQDVQMDAEQLLRQADQAMYQAKLAGKNRFHLFDFEHDALVREQYDATERMRQALDHKEFVLYFQPKVNMRTGEVIGAEALIRWNHPQQGLLLPGLFLPAIEGSMLSIALGEWVVESALSQYVLWRELGVDIPVSVNVGALQLQQPDFFDRLQYILNRFPSVTRSRIQLEILETSALSDIQKAMETINECRKIGVEFALDDFGTGYSSLTYLRQLPVSTLKIDQSFVRNMLENESDQAILRGVIGLAGAFGRNVLAEGVETEAHGVLLLKMGCEEAQGYGIARPMTGYQFPAWVQAWRPYSSWLNWI